MDYKIIEYPDGSSYVECWNLTDSHVEFTFRINSYKDLWHLRQLLDTLTFNNIGATVNIPCLLDAQADRRFKDNQSSGLLLVMDFLNRMVETDYTHSFRIFHPHNPEAVEMALECGEIIDNSDFINQVLDDLDLDNLILMSSDAGGFKPLMKLCDKIGWERETYSASKSRKWENGEIKLTQIVEREDFGGKDILIVDDICVYGGTFKGLATMLREKNVGKIYLAVSHMTIQNHKGDDTVFKYFDKVFTTNSKYDDYWVESFGGQPLQPQNLQIIKMFEV